MTIKRFKAFTRTILELKFFLLLLKIFPLYINIILGYFSTKLLDVKRESIASILIYILGPIVVFSATLSVKIDMSILFLPVFFYVFCSAIAFITLYVFRKSWSDPSGNILAFSAGTGNTGYFGIPLAIIFFPPYLADIYIFTVLASLLYESTTGFYVTAKGNFTVKESFHKMLKLPILYAFILGVIFNLLGVVIPEEVSSYTAQFKGAYGILGMMMLGMGMKGFNLEEDMDKKYIKIAYFFKFIFWPASILLIIFIKKAYFRLLTIIFWCIALIVDISNY